MPRRNRPARRLVTPDGRFQSTTVAEFINRMMHGGKKSTATTLLYNALTLVESHSKREPIEVLEQALKNIAPMVEVKARRVGGANYQVPVEVPPERRISLAMRWIIAAADARAGKSMAEKLAGELMDAANGQGEAMKKRETVHKMAEANRAFAHYRW